jgi:putative ABC transport system substrate-binding protein
LRRRTLLLLDLLAALFSAGTGAFEAQSTTKIHRVGILCAVTCATSDVSTFRGALSTLGYSEGSNIVFELRSAEGELDRLPSLASDLVRLRVDVIFTSWGTGAGLAAKQATATIPVVVGSAGDLVAAGLAASLKRPGGNVTGVSSLALDLEGKRLDILKQLLPTVQIVAIFGDSTNPYSVLAVAQERIAADKLGVKLREIRVHEARDVDEGFATILAEQLGALSIHAYVPILANRDRIVELAAKNRVVTIYPSEEFVHAGGLLSYGASLNENAKRAAVYVDKILNGAKPADLPIEQPTRFRLAVNLKTAEALGLTMPPSILALADEVIE